VALSTLMVPVPATGVGPDARKMLRPVVVTPSFVPMAMARSLVADTSMLNNPVALLKAKPEAFRDQYWPWVPETTVSRAVPRSALARAAACGWPVASVGPAVGVQETVRVLMIATHSYDPVITDPGLICRLRGASVEASPQARRPALTATGTTSTMRQCASDGTGASREGCAWSSHHIGVR
jgi:hypothetical protein